MKSTGAIRVMLVDAHPLMRAGVRAILESRSRLRVIAESNNDDDTINLAVATQPDVIVLDVDDRGCGVIPELVAAVQNSRLLALSGSYEFRTCLEAMQSHAHGVVWKKERPIMLVKAIRTVHNGESWFTRTMLARLLIEIQQPKTEISPEAKKISSLTEREREVVALLGEGLRNKEISARLHISESTVRHHFASLYSKLDVADRLALLVYAYRFGLLEQPRQVTIRT